jgi:hypothetical protein
MPEPKKTRVGLAGQKAWHIWAGAAAAGIKGKYLPSQLRTQKACPEPATTGRGGSRAGCELLPKGSTRKLACGGAGRLFGSTPPKKKSNRPSAEAGLVVSIRGLAITSPVLRQAPCGARGALGGTRYATLTPRPANGVGSNRELRAEAMSASALQSP